jgi:hypothetical protein
MLTLTDAARTTLSGKPTRAERAAALPADAFTPGDRAAVWFAGTTVAAVLDDITHHHIGDPGAWDLYGTTPDEIARLHDVLDQLAHTIREARGHLTLVERRARAAARRLNGGAR